MKTLTTRTRTQSQTQAEPTNLILAIDLGKYKSVACLHDPASGEVQFTTFVTSAERMKFSGLAG